MSLTELILASAAKATSQAPISMSDLVTKARRTNPDINHAKVFYALEQLCDQRQLATCRITRGGITQDWYWPTGLKPKESHPVPTDTKPDTQAARLIQAIVAHGPLIGADLAEKTGVKPSSIDPCLVAAIKSGSIVTRMGFVPEQGRERKHYMTATQAADWETQAAGPESPSPAETTDSHVMSHPRAEEAQETPQAELKRKLKTALELAGSTATIRQLQEQVDEMAARIDVQANELAAANLILASLAKTLQVDKIEELPDALDELTQALATRAVTTPAPAGKLALMLSEAGVMDLKYLNDEDPQDAARLAMHHVTQGNYVKCLVIRVIGQAIRTVEWQEAA
jgi:hypothetical protein